MHARPGSPQATTLDPATSTATGWSVPVGGRAWVVKDRPCSPRTQLTVLHLFSVVTSALPRGQGLKQFGELGLAFVLSSLIDLEREWRQNPPGYGPTRWPARARHCS